MTPLLLAAFLAAPTDTLVVGILTDPATLVPHRAPDAALKRARMGSDLETRLSAYREAQTLFQKDMPWVPLYHGSVFTAYRHAVRGLIIGPTGVLRYDKAWKLP